MLEEQSCAGHHGRLGGGGYSGGQDGCNVADHGICFVDVTDGGEGGDNVALFTRLHTYL